MTDDEILAREVERFQTLALLRHQQDNAVTGSALSECEVCGAGIPAERQKILKGVRLCVDCKALEEKRERLGL